VECAIVRMGDQRRAAVTETSIGAHDAARNDVIPVRTHREIRGLMQTESPLWLIGFKGYPGCGKSTVARALAQRLGWPLIDKDDIKTVLDSMLPKPDSAAYTIMWRLAERQLSVGVSAICDSPLMNETYGNAVALAQRSGARLIVIECRCPDDAILRDRIESRQGASFSQVHISDWASFQAYRATHGDQLYDYPISGPRLTLDTREPIAEIVDRTMDWLVTVGVRSKTTEL
jgi:predicted kinase